MWFGLGEKGGVSGKGKGVWRAKGRTGAARLSEIPTATIKMEALESILI